MKAGTAAAIGNLLLIPLCLAFPPLIFPLLLILIIASTTKR